MSQSHVLFTNGPNDTFRVWIDPSTGTLEAGVFTRTSYAHWMMQTSTSVGITSNKWYHVVFTYDGKRLTLYRNGKQVNYEDINQGNVVVSQYPVTFGGFTSMNGGTFSQFNGYLDEVVFFDLALSLDGAFRIFDELKHCYAP